MGQEREGPALCISMGLRGPYLSPGCWRLGRKRGVRSGCGVDGSQLKFLSPHTLPKQVQYEEEFYIISVSCIAL
jgi:hypothetical protein